jgi:tetratricopeptide (TPR) repeat protein/Cdc6-like AAA superfamily ATPase
MVPEISSESNVIVNLRNEWDYRPHLYNQPEHSITRHLHVAREESESLLDFITRKNEGSLLLSGHRGRGKTSLVLSTINRVGKTDEIELLPVLVNAPDFEFLNEMNDIRRPILQTLVRRLYQACTDKGMADEFGVTELYDRAVAKKVTTERSQNASENIESKLETESTLKLDITKQVSTIAASAIVALIFLLNPNIPYNYVYSIISIVAPSAILSIMWQRKKSNISQKGNKNTNSLYYLYDYDTATLQSEFERVLRILSDKEYRNSINESLNQSKKKQKQFRVMFVVDELDKISADLVLQAILAIKMLINQSLCLFIFISDTVFYNYIMDRSTRDLGEYTLFAQKMFLGRPSFKEMKSYIDNIVDENKLGEIHESVELKRSYDFFLNFACFESKTDFFELNNFIRDSCRYDLNGMPYLDIRLNNPSKLTKSNLQKAIEHLYEDNKYPQSIYRNRNDEMLDKLYELSLEICQEPKKTIIRVDNSSNFRIDFIDNESLLRDAQEKIIYSITSSDQIQEKAMLGLLRFLSYPLPGSDTLIKRIGQEGQAEQYEISGRLEVLPRLREQLTQDEGTFTQSYNELAKTLILYSNLLNRYRSRFTNQVIRNEMFDEKIDQIFHNLEGIGNHPLSALKLALETYRNLVIDTDDFIEASLSELTNIVNGIRIGMLEDFAGLMESIVASRDLEMDIQKVNSSKIYEILGVNDPLENNSVYLNSPALVLKKQTKEKIETVIIMNSPQFDDLKKIDEAISTKPNVTIYITVFDREILSHKDQSFEATLSENRGNFEYLHLIKFASDIRWTFGPKLYAINMNSNFDLITDIVLSILFWCYGNLGSPDTILSESRFLSQEGKLHEAITLLDQLLEIDPYSVPALMDLGYCQYTLGEYENSIYSNNKALETDVFQPEAWYNKGLALSALQRYEEALESFNAAIKINPLEDLYWIYRARAQSFLRRYMEAHRSIDHVISVNMNNPLAWESKARIFWSQRNDLQAISCIKSAIALDPNNLGYHKLLLSYLDNKNLDQDLKKVLNELPPEFEGDPDIVEFKKKIFGKSPKLGSAIKKSKQKPNQTDVKAR